ncbi:hypothetical protein ACG3SL_19770 [Sphingomonas sp. CJ20]
MNHALQRGEYFWVDIVRDGVVLYELPQHALAAPQPLTPVDAYQMAQGYFDHWLPSADEFYENFEFNQKRNRRNNAAFQLHQATERLYICFLLGGVDKVDSQAG